MSELRRPGRRLTPRKKIQRRLSRIGHSALAVCLACGMMVPAVGYADSDEVSNEDFASGQLTDVVSDESIETTEQAAPSETDSVDMGVDDSGAVSEIAMETESSESSEQAELETNAVEDETQPSDETSQSTASLSSNADTPPAAASSKQTDAQGLVIEGTVVVDYEGEGGEVVIPEGITEVGSAAFVGSNVSKVSFPSSLTRIGWRSFQDCDSLTEIRIPSGVTLEEKAFESCDAVSYIWIPANIATDISVNADGAFKGTGEFAIVEFEQGIETIPASLFAGSSVRNITIPDSVKEIGSYSFWGSVNLQQLALPSEVNLGDGSFSDCEGLQRVSIPADITNVDESGSTRPFDNSGAPAVFEIESGMTMIPDQLFYGINAEAIEIPEGVVEIGEEAFESSTINTVMFPSSLATIGWGAFIDCVNLKEIRLPSGLSSLGGAAFSGCKSLKSVWVPTSLSYVEDALSVFSGSQSLNIEIEEGATAIPDNLFQGASIATIEIPESITKIGAEAFSHAQLPAEWTLPSSITTIGEGAFSGCGFDTLTIASNIESGEDGFFSNTIRNLVIAEGVTEIPASLFGYSTISSVSFPSSLTSIGDDAFLRCSGITSLVLPEGLKELGASSFGDMSDLTEVSIPVSLETSGYYEKGDSWRVQEGAFEGCWSLVQVTLREGMTTIPAGLLSDTGIVTITVPDTVTKLGDYAFDTQTLKDIYIPDAVIDFGEGNFSSEPVIHCTEGSPAHQYAVEHYLNYTFDFVHSTHIYGEWFVDDEPTCTEPGIERHECTCGAYEEREIAPLGHSFGEWVVDTPPTLLAPGSQHRECERCDETETQEIPQIIADIEAHPDYSLAMLHVVDAATLANIDDATVTITDETSSDTENRLQQTVKTNAEGQAQFFIPAGTYYVQVEKSGYQIRGFEYAFEAGEMTLPDIGIATETLVQGSLTVEEMTVDEIKEAGIDTTAPGNEHIYKYEVMLGFVDGLEIYEFPSITLKNENGDVVGGSFNGIPIGNGSGPITTEFDPGEKGEPIRVCRVNEMLYIVIQGEAKWLKEMFHVQLLVVNTSQTDQIADAVAQLQLPDGVSLAEMTNGQQSPISEIGELATGEQKTVDWYVRGDATGDYTLTATLAGTMVPFGDSFTYSYQNEEPLHVYAGTDMKLTVKIDDAAYYQEPYTMIFELENISDHTIYNVTHQINNVSQYEVKEYAWLEDGEIVDYEEEWNTLDSADIGPEGRITREEFKPGEKLVVKVTTRILWESPLQSMVNTAAAIGKVAGFIPKIGGSIPTVLNPALTAASIVSKIDVRYWLTDTVVSTLEGSTTTIPTEFDIDHVAGVNIVDKVLDELFGVSSEPPDSEEIAEDLATDSLTVIFDKESVDIAKFLYDEMKAYEEVTTGDKVTACSAYAVDVEGTDVIAISGGGSGGGGGTAWSRSSEGGAVTIAGSGLIEVEALNPGVADLVVEDSNGNVARKRYVVREKLPGQERYLPEGTDTLDLDYVLMPGGTLLDGNTAALYEQLGLMLYGTEDADAQPVSVGSVIPTGSVLRSTIAEASSLIIVPGDVNSDGIVDETDVSVMETVGCMNTMRAAQKLAGDLTGDDVVDEQDAAVLRDYLGAQGNEGDSGDEPTPDGSDGPAEDPGAPSDPDDAPGFSEGAGAGDKPSEPDAPETVEPGDNPGVTPGGEEDEGQPGESGDSEAPGAPEEENPSVPGSGEGDAPEQQPSEEIEASKNEIINDLDELIESIEGSALPDDKKQALISKAQEMKDQTANASSSDALSTLRNEVSAYVSEVGATIESEGQGQGQEQESIDSGNDRDDGSGSGGSAAAKSDHARPKALIVATGDMSPQIVSSVLVFAMLGVIGLVIARRRIR